MYIIKSEPSQLLVSGCFEMSSTTCIYFTYKDIKKQLILNNFLYFIKKKTHLLTQKISRAFCKSNGQYTDYSTLPSQSTLFL